ncbi:hypothetical protein ALQ72_100936 [Pseudomonas syringae pv. maculicola]|uniref:Uncharacterized protein n=1 Tax=Pseudomonas syringae pv. maculicola TaxID=59511 RepID=A0A0N0WSQ5_PSEYM|nr:Unknown protein sequence [Pseudomonas syringae pv. maculicola]KPB96058.1 Unknown protein sequence [Pseudomonas syringae pv. maculicola]RML68889.1 hypothetical protein APX70_101017 [Pseudomonas syringae pv. maculicola]RMM76203.1 hypothetical protein ALQ72_100936 [Pseudomonas syringae pv. maculicola]
MALRGWVDDLAGRIQFSISANTSMSVAVQYQARIRSFIMILTFAQ